MAIQLDCVEQSPQPSHTARVDEHAQVRINGLATLALSSQLGRALLFVDDHGRTADVAQLFHRPVELIAMPYHYARGQIALAIPLRLGR